MKKNLLLARAMIRALCPGSVLTKCRRGELLRQFTAWSKDPEEFDCFAENLLSEFVKMSPAQRHRIRRIYKQWKKAPMVTKRQLEHDNFVKAQALSKRAF
jgi:hypothetical protein